MFTNDHLKEAINHPHKEIPVPNSGDRFVLLDPDSGPGDHQFPNLERLTATDEVVWTAALPIGGVEGFADRYVNIAWHAGELVGHLWSGYRVIIDPETGESRSTVFTK